MLFRSPGHAPTKTWEDPGLDTSPYRTELNAVNHYPCYCPQSFLPPRATPRVTLLEGSAGADERFHPAVKSTVLLTVPDKAKYRNLSLEDPVSLHV